MVFLRFLSKSSTLRTKSKSLMLNVFRQVESCRLRHDIDGKVSGGIEFDQPETSIIYPRFWHI